MNRPVCDDIDRENAALASCARSLARLMRTLRLGDNAPSLFLLRPESGNVLPFHLSAFDENGNMFWLGHRGRWALPAEARLEGDPRAFADLVTSLGDAFPKEPAFLQAYIYRSSVIIVRHIAPLAHGVMSVFRLSSGPVLHPNDGTPLAKAVRAAASTLRDGSHVIIGATPDISAVWSAHERLAIEEFRMGLAAGVRATFDDIFSRQELVAGFQRDTQFVLRRENDLAVLRAESPAYGHRDVLAVADLPDPGSCNAAAAPYP